MDVSFQVVQADAQSFACDVLVLKYAQRLYGLDELVAGVLMTAQSPAAQIAPSPGDYALLPTHDLLPARHVLFVGVPKLSQIDYAEIRIFARQSLHILAQQLPNTRTVAMTIHGIGPGLDESESFLAQVAGLLDAIQAGDVPPALESITIVERIERRAQRLQKVLESQQRLITPLMDDAFFGAPRRSAGAEKSFDSQVVFNTINAGAQSNAKPHIFVAMPFRKDMEDVFYYGIQKPAHEAGYLCERMDMETFTGDILTRIKERIETAKLVIADLTGANPNVYLEVGYAWGKNRPTLLIAKQGDELKFDVQGQRCVLYETIRDLEQQLAKDLSTLSSARF
jgi:hypothetical protein